MAEKSFSTAKFDKSSSSRGTFVLLEVNSSSSKRIDLLCYVYAKTL